MPRDDLTINNVEGNPYLKAIKAVEENRQLLIMAQQKESLDTAGVIDDFVYRTANLPAELKHFSDEIEAKDKEYDGCLSVARKAEEAMQKWYRINGPQQVNPKEEGLTKLARENYAKAELLSDEKIALAKKMDFLLERHLMYLDKNVQSLQERGEFPTDADMPSLLRPQTQDRADRPEPSAAAMPLNRINNPAGIHTRHPNQQPVKPLPPHVQSHHISGGSSSAPASPVAILKEQQRQREASLGAAMKRKHLTGGVGINTTSSGLARHSSLTPGTPRAGTPSGGRAGSAGPRASQKGLPSKKIAPQGSRQSGVPRKSKPGKSSLSRVKRTGNKNSPSSTNDSDLSDAESGSVDEDDEAVTPPRNKDGDGDDEMVDVDDEEGGDDRKYCLCQNVSHGDMVACDNESCPYEWFHWSCVGLKSEPVGTWICPVCTKNMKK